MTAPRRQRRELTTLPSLGEQMRHMLGWRNWPLEDFPEDSFFAEEWSPAVDVRENSDAYVVQADIPGVKPEDMDVTLENGVLTIRGQRREEKKDEGENYHRIERFSGSFSRRFVLPEAADADNVEANMDQGVLVVRIPKTEKATQRKIEIKG